MDQVGQRRIERARRHFRRACRTLATIVTVWELAAPASAQYGETAQVTRPIPATNSLDATAAGSEVVIRDRTVAQTTDQLLQESAGTRVVAEGGLGTPFCVRLRGVACDQVTVMLGDVPLSSPDTGSFDLSLVPLEALDGFEVFRGGAPAWLNEGAVGGVLRLLPRTYKENQVGGRVTGGSFGSWRANLFGAAAGEKVQFFVTAGGAGAQNDYPYLDDNGTRFDPTDDVERTRRNADFVPHPIRDRRLKAEPWRARLSSMKPSRCGSSFPPATSGRRGREAMSLSTTARGSWGRGHRFRAVL